MVGVKKQCLHVVHNENSNSSHLGLINEHKKGSSRQSRGDDYWHEKQINRKTVIKRKIDEYVNNFSVHGLTKVFNGSRCESFFWLIMLTGGVCLSIVIIQGLFRKYLKFEVYTEISSKITERNYFPSITICEHHGFASNYFSYCGSTIKTAFRSNAPRCSRAINHPNQTRFVKKRFWSNGVFNVTKCKTWGGKDCLASVHFKSLVYFNGTCMTWNPSGTIFDMYGHVDIEFQYQIPPHQTEENVKIVAMPHDPDIQEIDVTKSIEIDPFKSYQIKLDKTIVKRLKSPFPSKCSHDKGSDIFPGGYSRRSCIESNSFIEMYKACGATFDYVDRYIPLGIKEGYKHRSKNKTMSQLALCMFSNGKREVQETYSCPFACQSMDLSTISTFSENKKTKLFDARSNSECLVYSIGLQYQSVDSYKVMEEKEVYSWDQMACEMGGFIGLVIGSSFISLVEIIAYVILRTVYQFI